LTNLDGLILTLFLGCYLNAVFARRGNPRRHATAGDFEIGVFDYGVGKFPLIISRVRNPTVDGK
jgi:hypothetical protein